MREVVFAICAIFAEVLFRLCRAGRAEQSNCVNAPRFVSLRVIEAIDFVASVIRSFSNAFDTNRIGCVYCQENSCKLIFFTWKSKLS